MLDGGEIGTRRKIMSNIQCRPFSIIEWLRIMGPIWFAAKTSEVM
jgi:hypothetical protein